MQASASKGTEQCDRSNPIIGFRKSAALPDAQYFYARPSSPEPDAPVLVAVHGISRNAREQAQSFARYCNSLGCMVVAPFFPHDRFPKYQQLGVSQKHTYPRPDLALNAILEDVAKLTGVNTARVFMFGYSGGGQFVHRYALVHPHRVIAAALGAPGWYTFPELRAPFPRGLRLNSGEAGFSLDHDEALKVPMAVFVGMQDLSRDKTLNTLRKIDSHQGRTRFERGQRWVAAMRDAARDRGLDTRYEFCGLEDCGHSFTECVVTGRMDDKALEFLMSVATPTLKADTNTVGPVRSTEQQSESTPELADH